MGRAYQNRKESMAKTSDAKARVYSKYGRVIYMCAKEGGIDPEGNLALRGLIERAKKDQVPTHVIEKAINKAQGGGGEDFSVARYEGYGPGGCMVIVAFKQWHLIGMRLMPLFTAAAENLIFKQAKLFFQVMDFFLVFYFQIINQRNDYIFR